MGKVIAFALEAAGAPVVRGGAGQAVEAFRRLIEENGGELRSGADVDRILVRNGKACGVGLPTAPNTRHPNVICSVTPGQLYNRLLRDETAQLPAERNHRPEPVPARPWQFPAALCDRWPCPLENRGA
jgi:phytoene dehydrogenase-like protein